MNPDNSFSNQPHHVGGVNHPKTTNKGSKGKAVAALVIVAVVAVSAVLAGYLLTRSSGEDGFTGGRVAMTAQGFNPEIIQVKKGQTVTWLNQSQFSRQVTGDLPEIAPTIGFDSGNKLEQGDSFTYKFEEAGSYTYYDRSNPVSTKGTVIVTE